MTLLLRHSGWPESCKSVLQICDHIRSDEVTPKRGTCDFDLKQAIWGHRSHPLTSSPGVLPFQRLSRNRRLFFLDCRRRPFSGNSPKQDGARGNRGTSLAYTGFKHTVPGTYVIRKRTFKASLSGNCLSSQTREGCGPRPSFRPPHVSPALDDEADRLCPSGRRPCERLPPLL